LIQAFHPDGEALRHFGVYPAIVTDIVDPKNLGRIEVKFPWLGKDGARVRAWATLLTPYADDDQGFEMLPSEGTQVVVVFEAGELWRPYIVGSCWNGKEKLPQDPAKPNNIRVIKTRSGSKLEFDDTEGAEKVTVSMKQGHQLVLDNGANEIQLTHADGSIIRFTAGGQIEIQANATVEVTASALNVHAATATFDGVINCTTLTASSSVVSPVFTPAAGNIW
jgi:uncharacterized protein involved in type VI secretion and phage assembly